MKPIFQVRDGLVDLALPVDEEPLVVPVADDEVVEAPPPPQPLRPSPAANDASDARGTIARPASARRRLRSGP